MSRVSNRLWELQRDEQDEWDQALDRLVDAYVDWREECVVVEVTQSSYQGVATEHVADGYTAYMAALDREEQAAAKYESRIYECRFLFAGGASELGRRAAA